MLGKFHAGLAVVALILSAPFASAQEAVPPLPETIKSEGALRVGVRCDQPPYGYKDEKGAFAGIEVEMARQMATWAFGSADKAQLTCVTAENRVPQLMGKKVDLLIATLGVTPERERVVAFSKPYRWGGSDVLVPQDSPIRKLDDLKGKKVIILKGTTQAKWFEDKMPDVETMRLNTASDALQSLKQGRGDAYSHDAATLVVAAAQDKSLRLVGEPFAMSDAAAGVRKNDKEWLAYVNAALDRMKAESLYQGWVEKIVPAEIQSYYINVFANEKPQGR